ncbi:MAG: hypothetical protein A3B10_00885 [Candidatus Doudnabacteria bacterium RIFCSPLOWO2_01_FULL_44_21]|uniref:Uncharacterized protein n=1 Tax=Candidatus Doudnabacteria bacterium RIFCSPLOWO2_01_FULL_44_21 TaxID=1817841 RepID=A0A1F5PY69_9BACT|nr:MAG: hypothetical protein A3B10_00885 [Candidatus Doudnabacteria bacterium RIFCSPLOWO2_01_FULL_44_21]
MEEQRRVNNEEGDKSKEMLHEEIIKKGQELANLWTDFEMTTSTLQAYGVSGFRVKELMEDIGRYGIKGGAIVHQQRGVDKAQKKLEGGDYLGSREELGKAYRGFVRNEKIPVIQEFINSLSAWDPRSGVEIDTEPVGEFISSLRDGLKEISVDFAGGTGIGSVMRGRDAAGDQKNPEIRKTIDSLIGLYKAMSDKVGEIKLLAMRIKRTK